MVKRFPLCQRCDRALSGMFADCKEYCTYCEFRNGAERDLGLDIDAFKIKV